MAMLVHIADARHAERIRRAGIVPSRWRVPERRGVYASPVLPNYFLSHQWARELKRRGMRTLVGIHFRVSDRELVLVGHYGNPPASMTASRAVRLIMDAADARGYEIVVPRKIEAKEIHAIRGISRVVGWRYYPAAHGKYVCGCPACAKGGIKSRRLRAAFENEMNPSRRGAGKPGAEG